VAEIDYLRARARTERAAACTALRMIVRLRHLEFAEAYDFRVRELEAEERRVVTRLAEAA
jgi:hypothetical protein